MPYGSNIITSIFGRRLGLQPMSSAQSGTNQASRVSEYLVGPDAIRGEVVAETTGTFLKAQGVSYLTTGNMAGGTTVVFRMDPPVPGVAKTIVFGTTITGAMSVKAFVTLSTGGAETLVTTAGSSFTVLASSIGAVLQLMGVTTAVWGSNLTTGQGISLTTTT